MQNKNVKSFAITLFFIGFTGLQAQSVKDTDGNVYKTITIGKQVWMAENLKTTKFNNGRAIPMVTENAAWEKIAKPAYCWYNNDIVNKDVYGALYNWFTVKTGKLCPAGWHVPSDTEWTILTTYLGGEKAAGGKLKETGTTHWQSPNTGATNETGFTALPGGERHYAGPYLNLGENGRWWSSTEYLASMTYIRSVYYLDIYVFRTNFANQNGSSVRCLQD